MSEGTKKQLQVGDVVYCNSTHTFERYFISRVTEKRAFAKINDRVEKQFVREYGQRVQVVGDDSRLRWSYYPANEALNEKWKLFRQRQETKSALNIALESVSKMDYDKLRHIADFLKNLG